MSNIIYIGDNFTESTKCSYIDTSMIFRRLNHIDMGGKKIVNLGEPVEEKDAINLKKFDTEIAVLEARINRDLGDKYNFNYPKLTNLLAGTKDTDAVNFKQLKGLQGYSA